ncbi:phosphatidylserine synthase [Escherichia coli]|nr:phosphatidylserine synthase [Escherichia coli]
MNLFKIIGALPYLYEINLRRFLSRLQYYVNTDQLVVRLWKDDDNTYHLKGMWVDDKWMLITGNNLNPRAWRLDLENAILIPRSTTGACAAARERTGADPRAYHHR